MGCLFTKVKEPVDGIYLDVHELKEVPVLQEQPTSSLKKRRKASKDPGTVLPPGPESQQEELQKLELTLPLSESPSFAETVAPSSLRSPDSEIIANQNLLDDDDNVSELEALPRRAFSENIGNGCRTKKNSDCSKPGEAEKLTRKCSFGIETKIIEFNPKKSINIYRLDSGSIRDEEDDLSYYEVSFEDEQGPDYTEVNDSSPVHLNESLSFQNANFDDSQMENTRNNEGSATAANSTFPKSYKTSQQTPSIYSTVSHQAYSGAKRAISNRKTPGGIWDNHVQQMAGTNITQQQNRVTQSSKDANVTYSYSSKGRQNSVDRNAVLSSDEPPVVYHTKRRISTISISSNDKEELNALDGVTHLHPHPGSGSDRRNSTTFDNSVRRLSSNFVGFFHS